MACLSFSSSDPWSKDKVPLEFDRDEANTSDDEWQNKQSELKSAGVPVIDPKNIDQFDMQGAIANALGQMLSQQKSKESTECELIAANERKRLNGVQSKNGRFPWSVR